MARVTKKTGPSSPKSNGGAAKPKAAAHVAAGHMDPAHVARLRRLSRETDVRDADVGFVGSPHSRDDMTELLGESTVSAMTSGESTLADEWDRPQEEEDGGPFVETLAIDEFATGTDESNIEDATREPFPTTSSAD